MYFGYVDWFVIIGSLLGLIGLYGWNRNQYFKKRNINHLKPTLFFGNTLQVILGKKHYVDVTKKVYDKFPEDKYVGMYDFWNPVYVIKDVDLIKQITVKDFDHFVDHVKFTDEDLDPLLGKNLFVLESEKWREMRNTLSPAFTGAKMRGMFPFILECAQNFVEYLKNETEKQTSKEIGYAEFDTKEITSRYTNDVIASCAFGYKVNSHNDQTNKFLLMAKDFTDFKYFDMLKIYVYGISPFLYRLFRLGKFEKVSNSFFRNLVMGSIGSRENNKNVRPDMIHLLMLAKQGSLNMDDSSIAKSEIAAVREDKTNNNKSKKTKWTDDELTAQAMFFLFAGFDTTSYAISFLFHELAINTHVQEKLQAEIDDYMNNNDGNVEYSDLSKLKYLDMVVTETLRLWPSAPMTDRVCVKPYALPPQNDKSNTKHKLEKGDTLFISVFDIQRDPKNYTDPNKFIPERFSDENNVYTNTAKYIPFGMGPRACIGSRFALMGLKMIALYTLAQFDIVATPKTSNPVILEPHYFNLRPENGFWIGIRKRNI